ncbi:MAG: quinone oxidoreductase [actinobacterium acMicro-4]|nr:MAG: quinone oxidoreductase [actinobacterium acMicro-4]MCF8547726.1 quinone oxidoreductase [Pontimonas sp.]
MKAVLVSQHGGPEVLAYSDVPEPEITPSELLVRVAAAGINYIDTYQRSGIYAMTLPYTPGLEGAGTVLEVGSEVTGFAVGDTLAWTSQLGSYAEFVALDASKAVSVPSGIEPTQAAQAMLQGITAHYLITSVFEIKRGTTALVHAAAGGVGLLLCQMISARGGTVIGTVSTEAKAAAASAAGAAHVIRYDQEDFIPRVRELTGGIGVDVVYDGVGASTFDGSLRSLKPRGMMVLFGQASGPVGAFDPQILNSLGSLSLTRPSLMNFIQTREELQWRASEVFEAMLSGDLTMTLGGSYPLADAAQAHQDLEARKSSGKLILIP